MTEIAAELATFVRQKWPTSNANYKTAQDSLWISYNMPWGDSRGFLRWNVRPPRRQDIVTLFLDVYLEKGSSLGSGELRAQLMQVNGPGYRRMTWNNGPDEADVGYRVGTVSGRRVRFDVTGDHGELVLEDGSLSPWMNYKFTRAGAAGITRLVGPKGGRYAPRMVMTTQPREFDPTDLSPTGNIGIPKPVVEWTCPVNIGLTQVQFDELGGDFTTPLYDSGQIGATYVTRNRRRHDTATGQAWAGVPLAGASWRVRHKMAGGDWSGWVEGEVTYVPKPSPVLLNPGATDADPTPPLVWDLEAESFQVLVSRGNRVVLDTGVLPGPATTYTPNRGAVVDGESVRREVRWFDEVARTPSIGDPPYVSMVQDTTWVKSATVPPMTGLTVTQGPGSPLVVASAARVGSLPDAAWFGWDDSAGQLVDGTDGLMVRDWTVPPNRDVDYAARAVVNGKHSQDVLVRLRTVVTGVWLVDPETERGFVLDGLECQIASGEVVVVNEPISAAALIRRTLMLRDEAGTVTGQIGDRRGRTRGQQREDALWMREYPERVYRLILGDLNIPVTTTIKKPVFDPVASFHDRILHNITFDFSHAGDEA